jgi:UDP-glucose 4-epimerase
MRLLITGAAGFIGTHAVKAALARGWDVDSLDMSHPQEHRRMDCRLLKRIEANCILHLGAYSSNAGFADNMAENYANNVFGLWNVLRLAQQSGARVVYASSSAVYGPNRERRECADEIGSGIVVEQAHSHYCRSKRINELMAASYPNALGLRIFNAYGLGDELKQHCSPMAHFIRSKRAGEPMVIYGDGSQAKDFIHITDVVEIIMRLIEIPQECGWNAVGVLNVGTGVATSFNDLAAMIGGEVQYKPMPDPESYQYFTRADTTRLLSIIGPYKFVMVKEGLA